MLFSKNPKSEQLSRSINAEIERKVGERFREIEERLDQRVQQTIHEDREFVKDTIGVAFKIGGFAVALVVVVLGALGWKTFGDVYNAMIQAAAKKSEEYFSTPQGRLIIDSTLDHAVLDSCLVRIALMNADQEAYKKLYTKLVIDDNDADRLLRIMINDKYDDAMFRSAVSVLMLAFARPDRTNNAMLTEVGAALASFVSAKDKDAKWLEKNRGRRRWLLEQLNESRFAEGQIKVACRQLLSSDASSELKRGAMTYLGTIKDHDALDKLIELAIKGKELSDDALIAVANIDPKSDVLTKWTADLEKNANPPLETINTALKLSEILQHGPEYETSLKLVEFAARHSRLSLYVYQRQAGDETTRDEVVMLSDIERNYSVRIPSTLLFDGKDGWTKTVEEIFKRSAQQPDLRDFTPFARWLIMPIQNTRPVRFVTVRVLMRGSSAIRLVNGQKLDNRSASEGFIVMPNDATENGKRSEQIGIMWFNETPGGPSGGEDILTKFENAKDVTLKRETYP